ncbi:hypothetical protein [Chitinilyticum piscinae]|uniref:Uncharacterized protein n=1 Tax=Chitinilyticum piscinae TaxID=2866724 RepID=A0A8J7FRL3_9NEIS|nr:hypothetical protein [Chitinilyticum piscinae]MBE9609606.1 hypothetical protein [Chitinilyticum piscinae]
MNPQLYETAELVQIEQQAGQMLETAKPESRLYQLAYRLRLYLQLELIRRGVFSRRAARLRAGGS